jgi:hypothetical protein
VTYALLMSRRRRGQTGQPHGLTTRSTSSSGE